MLVRLEPGVSNHFTCEYLAYVMYVHINDCSLIIVSHMLYYVLNATCYMSYHIYIYIYIFLYFTKG